LTDKRYIIGIDLGTTNSAVSYVDLEASGSRRIKLFQVPQLAGAGEFSGLPVLPSFLYIPGPYDISGDAIAIPWKTEEDNFVGAFARDHGSKVPARLVSSAKSWLCHSRVDRHARILPWGAGDEVYKVSPVQATAAYLKHIRKAWNSQKGEDADLYLENQAVVVTVPASFDEVARDLTLEAAQIAGLGQVTLLEEPLAAFYSWLIDHEKDWRDHVNPNELILVCDVGGGTTDFTLITLREVEGSPRFERIAVGDHLLLGGDNVDLTLARRLEMKICEGQGRKALSLSTDRWKALCHQSRLAKEMILDGKTDSRKITLMGEGAKLIAETISADMDRVMVEQTVLDGFFPLVDADTGSADVQRKGITEFGLPYEPEPAITRHLGRFLERHRPDVEKVLGRESCEPELVLFNGGSLKSGLIRERIRAAVRNWFGQANTDLPRVMDNPNPDLAVALGASYYGLVKMGQGVRVGSGSPRSYYLGVNTQDNIAEKNNPSAQAICIIERGLDEGSRIELPDRKFEVLANQPVAFDIYSSSYRSGDRCGDLTTIDDTLTVLPPIHTLVQYGKKGVKTAIPVSIEAEYTEMGTLALWCRSGVSNHRWRLQFQLRDAAASAGEVREDIIEDEILELSRRRVREAFSKTAERRKLESLAKTISNEADIPRKEWPLGLIRPIADELLELGDAARLRQEMEIRWLNMLGFCMRPGFGDGFDEHRMKAIWKFHKKGPKFPKNSQVRSEWWIMWRRVAGGLKAGQQRQFIQELSSQIISKKGTKTKNKIMPQERLEIWMAVANMERLLVKDKITWGNQLLSEIHPKKSKPQHFWSLARLGARELLYGPADRVIPPDEAAKWIKIILNKKWVDPKPVLNALSQMARKTGDRTRDLDENLIIQVIAFMERFPDSDPYSQILKQIVPIAKKEENTIFGESLPSGIILRG
jgi:molecular chaperone DnaK (HSP70)